MSREELMEPRYKVIADYPLASLKVGQIFSPCNKDNSHCVVQGGYWWSDPNDYPHLFQKLEWWEERKPEDFPMYAKTQAGNSVRKVESIDAVWEKIVFVGGKVRKLKQWFPATEEEYNAFLTTTR